MRALITGGAGFVGSHIAERLLAAGDEVTILDNLLTGRRGNVPAAATFVEGDIRDDVTVRALGGVWDVIYHAAATYRDPTNWELDTRTNVIGTINVVREAQRSGAKLIYFQTSLCYGINPYAMLPRRRAFPLPVDARLDPRGSYAVTKTAGEAFIRDSGVPYVSLRLANMFGPRNLSGPAPAFYKRLTAGQPCTVVDSRRDYMFIDDLVDVAVKAATQGQGVYHVSSGRDYPTIDVYHAMTAALGMDLPEPAIVPRGADDAATILLDPSRTEQEFDWEPQVTLADGIARAAAWYWINGVEAVFTHLKLGG